jgi:hypothetical protein
MNRDNRIKSIEGLLAYCETLTDEDKKHLRTLVALKSVDELQSMAEEGIRNGHSHFMEVAIILRQLADLGVY